MKKIFIFFIIIIPFLLPSIALFVGGEGSDETGHRVNKHTELL